MTNRITTLYVVTATEEKDYSSADFLYGDFELAFFEKEEANEMCATLCRDACFGLDGESLASEVGIEYVVQKIEADYLDNEEQEDYVAKYGIDDHAQDQVRGLLNGMVR